MKVTYYKDTDTLHIVLRTSVVTEIRDLNEDMLIELDAQGGICAITVEHASMRAGMPEISYEQDPV